VKWPFQRRALTTCPGALPGHGSPAEPVKGSKIAEPPPICAATPAAANPSPAHPGSPKPDAHQAAAAAESGQAATLTPSLPPPRQTRRLLAGELPADGPPRLSPATRQEPCCHEVRCRICRQGGGAPEHWWRAQIHCYGAGGVPGAGVAGLAGCRPRRRLANATGPRMGRLAVTKITTARRACRWGAARAGPALVGSWATPDTRNLDCPARSAAPVNNLRGESCLLSGGPSNAYQTLVLTPRVLSRERSMAALAGQCPL
jgi:hypothetical protein